MRSTSWYNSRVGSYETLSNSTGAARRAPAEPPLSASRPQAPVAATATSKLTAGKIFISEIHLRAEDERVLGGPGSFTIAVEGRALEVERVAEIASQIPVEAECPGVRVGTRPRGGEAERHGVAVDAQTVIACCDLEGAEAAIRKIRHRARAHAGPRIRRRFPGEHVRRRDLPGALRNL